MKLLKVNLSKMITHDVIERLVDKRRKIVIHCPDEQEAEFVTNALHHCGLRWTSGADLTNASWHVYGNETCYHISRYKFSPENIVVTRSDINYVTTDSNQNMLFIQAQCFLYNPNILLQL